jgi:F-type H+-transporting ATPase subunit b
MRYVLAIVPILAASAAQAASGPFFSLRNTDFVVLIAFLLFVALLVYFKVPGMLTRLLDKRAETIREELETARRLREEASALLESYERKQREVQAQADRIVAAARDDALAAAALAKEDLRRTIDRRLHAAEEQIAAAEAEAVRAVRERAIGVAVAAAGDVLRAQMTPAEASAMVDASIREVGERLH